MSGLSDKQKAFIEEYFVDFNATRAAGRAGYRGSENTLAVTGHRLLRNDKIRRRISARFKARCMDADEVLARLAEQARADISDFVDECGVIDWAKVKAKGYLIKRISHTKGKNSVIELYDGQNALALIGKAHALFRERHEHSGPDGQPFQVLFRSINVTDSEPVED